MPQLFLSICTSAGSGRQYGDDFRRRQPSDSRRCRCGRRFRPHRNQAYEPAASDGRRLLGDRPIGHRLDHQRRGDGAGATPVCVNAQDTVQLGIMSMFNIRSKSVEASTFTTIAGGASNYEIALVLDNSGSMNESMSGNSKIAALRTAATNFINTMFNGPFTGKVKMSIVPFAGLVSLSSNDTSNGSASWIDTQGKPSWHWKTFKNHSTVGFTNRLDIFKNLKAVNSDWAWAGCFETRHTRRTSTIRLRRARRPTLFMCPISRRTKWIPSKRVPAGTARPHRPIRTTTSMTLRRAADQAPLRRRTTSRCPTTRAR